MTTLKDVQIVQCNMLDAFAKVCEKHNLRWFIDSGTLLGQVRHGGFIPWDDDIDVVMPRDDYAKLVALGNPFDYPFFLQTYITDPQECSFNVQLRKIDTTKIRTFELTPFFRHDKEFTSCKGIAMDICPIDYIPENEKERNTISKFIKFLHHYNSQRLITYKEYNDYLSVEDYLHAVKLFDHSMTKIGIVNKDSGLMACTTWWGFNQYAGYTVSADCYKDYRLAKFEGCKELVRVPVGYDEILKTYYGDYMKEKKGGSLHDAVLLDTLFDHTRSYHEYEQYTNQELADMIQARNEQIQNQK